MPWLSPALQVQWGPYFRTDSDEEQKIVASVVAAKNAGLIDKRKAIEKLAPIFGIENVDAFIQGLDKEKQDEVDTEHARSLELAKASKPQQPEHPPLGKPAAGIAT